MEHPERDAESASADHTRQILVRCPDCGGELKVDAATGEVLSHRSAQVEREPSKDFDSLLAGLDESKRHAESVFEREMGALQDRDRLMDEKFRQALERAEKEDGRQAATKSLRPGLSSCITRSHRRDSVSAVGFRRADLRAASKLA